MSNLHIQNSVDLLNKIKTLNMKNKSLASLDLELLSYTNIPINKCIIRLRNKHYISFTC